VREIKFRAFTWDTRYPDYEKKNYMLDVLAIDFEKGIIILPYKIDKTREEKLSNVKLVQYTEKKDINKKEIFEDDIVKNIDSPVEFHRWIKTAKVEIKPSGVIPCGEYDSDCGDYSDGDNWEIIGNIHENPELLN
jgi:uncharacterized phage protein (TIGR01671 family)